MYGTLFSILIALFVLFYPSDVIPGESMMGITLIIVASLFVIMQGFSFAMAWWPLQKAERDFTPRILQLFKKDRHIRLINFWLLFFPLISYAIAVDLIFLNLFPKKTLLAFWVVLLGISVDAVHHFFRRILDYLNPFAVTELISAQATESVQHEMPMELCQWFDALTEVAIKAIERTSSSLANHAINTIPGIVNNYLKSIKTIAHPSQGEKVNYTMFYLFQRLEIVNQHAIEHHLVPVCTNLINAVGRIIFRAAEFDLSVIDHPLQSIEHFAIHAQDEHMTEVAEQAIYTLVEVARTILKDIDVTYLELKEPFLSLISVLEEITKEEFRQDKSINIKILKHPFEELKEMISQLPDHQDTKVIINDIDRVLAEFTELDLIMRTVPPLSDVTEEEEESPNDSS